VYIKGRITGDAIDADVINFPRDCQHHLMKCRFSPGSMMSPARSTRAVRRRAPSAYKLGSGSDHEKGPAEAGRDLREAS
jgi:hypothetical protein